MDDAVGAAERSDDRDVWPEPFLGSGYRVADHHEAVTATDQRGARGPEPHPAAGRMSDRRDGHVGEIA